MRGRLISRKTTRRRWDMGRIPGPGLREQGVSQRTVEIGPEPGLMAQILRLAVTPVEPGKGAEQPGISLRRHDGVKRGETGRIERVVGRAPRLDIAHKQRQLELLGDVDPRILRQRYQRSE